MIRMVREPQSKKSYDRRRNQRQYQRWRVVLTSEEKTVTIPKICGRGKREIDPDIQEKKGTEAVFMRGAVSSVGRASAF